MVAPNEFSQTQPLLPERRGPESFILRRLLISGFACKKALSSPLLYLLKAAGTARLTGARTPTVPRLCRAAARPASASHTSRPCRQRLLPRPCEYSTPSGSFSFLFRHPPHAPRPAAEQRKAHATPSLPRPRSEAEPVSFSSRDVSGCGCDHINRRGPPLKIGFQGRIRVSPGPVNLV